MGEVSEQQPKVQQIEDYGLVSHPPLRRPLFAA